MISEHLNNCSILKLEDVWSDLELQQQQQQSQPPQQNQQLTKSSSKQDLNEKQNLMSKAQKQQQKNHQESIYCFSTSKLFFYVGEEKMKFVKNELLKEDPTIFTNYEQKRQEGENESYICSLIRQDSVVEFI